MATNFWRLCSLFLISSVVSPVLADGSLGTASAGEAPFVRACAMCHGPKGEGDKGPPIVPLIYLEPQIRAIVRGGQGEMSPIPKATLTNKELSAIVAYLGSLK